MAKWWSDYKQKHPELAGLPEVARHSHGIHLRRPDGQIEAHICGAAAFYEAPSGAMLELDPEDIRDSGDEWFVPGLKGRVQKSNKKTRVSVDGVYSQTTSRIGRFDPSTKTFTPLWTIPSGALVGDRIVSSGNGWNHQIIWTRDGMREIFVVETNPGSMGAQPGEYIVMETIIEGITFADGEVGAFEFEGVEHALPVAHDGLELDLTCTRFAVNTGGVQYLYTGVPASLFADANYPIVIDPDFVASWSWRCYGYNASYATAHSTYAGQWNNGEITVGQTTSYLIKRMFLRFKTDQIGAGATVTQVNMKIAVNNMDQVVQDFTTKIMKYAWAGLDGATAYPGVLSATAETNNWGSTSGQSIDTYYTSGNLDTSWVDTEGDTEYGLVSDRDLASTTPTVSELIRYHWLQWVNRSYGYEPVLVVVFTDTDSPITKYAGTITSAGSAPYDDVKWARTIRGHYDDGFFTSCGRIASDTTATPDFPKAGSSFQGTDGNDDWVSPGNITANDTSYASITASTFDNNDESYVLLAEFTSGTTVGETTVPYDSTITGIEIAFSRWYAAGSASDFRVQLYNKNTSSFVGTDISAAASWPSSEAEIVYGGSGQMWGLTSAEVIALMNPAGLGSGDLGYLCCGFQATAKSNNTDIYANYATIVLYWDYGYRLDAGQYSELLKYQNFPISLPSTATVQGIYVTIQRRGSTGSTIKDALVQLIGPAGTLIGNNKADTSTTWPETFTNAYYGGSTDLWGTSGLTYSDFNDPDFGVAISVLASVTDDVVADIDFVSLTLYWSDGASAALTGSVVTVSSGTIGISRDNALTGSAASALAGTLVPTPEFALTGEAVSVLAGALSPEFAVALTGEEATVSAGTLAISTSVALTGSEVSAFAGTITAETDTSVEVALTGSSVSVLAGTLVPGVDVLLSGEVSSALAGTLVVSTSVALIGEAVSALAGTVTAGVAYFVELTGEAVSVLAGTLVPDSVVALTGEAVVVSDGSLSVSTSVALTGEAVSSFAGTVTPDTGYFVALTGLAVSVLAGTLGVDRERGLSGSEVVVTAGSVVATPAVLLSGASSAALAGTLGVDRTTSLSGASSAALAGTLGVTHAQALAGSEVLGFSGSVSPELAVALAGIEVAALAGTLTAIAGGNVQVALTGSAVAALAGALGVSLSKAIGGSEVAVFAGTLSASVDYYAALTGSSVEVLAGTLGVTRDSPLSGAVVQALSGAVVPGSAQALTGASVSTLSGYLVPDIARALTGAVVVSQAGSVSPALQVALAGSVSSVVAGALGVDREVALSSGTVTVEAGTVVGLPEYFRQLVGSEVSVLAGTLGIIIGSDVFVALTGSRVQALAGTLGHSVSVGLTGAVVDVYAGDLVAEVYWRDLLERTVSVMRSLDRVGNVTMVVERDAEAHQLVVGSVYLLGGDDE